MSESVVNVKITSTAQLEALKQTEKQLLQQATAARAAGASAKELEVYYKRLSAVQGQMKEMGFPRRLGAEVMSMAQNVPILGRVMTAANGGVGLLSVGLGAVTAAALAARSALASFSTIEDIQTSFTTLLGKGGAKARMGELSKFAAQTPFDLPEVARASKVLENLTGGALSTGQGLRMVGDVAAATNTNFSEVAVTVGRLYQGLRDGAPVGEAAARMTELTGINLRQAKSWEEVAAALAKYNGEMERRSHTTSGKESNLGDSVGAFMAQVGRPLAPIYKGALQRTSDFLGGWAEQMRLGMDEYERMQSWRDPLPPPVEKKPAAKPEPVAQDVHLKNVEQRVRAAMGPLPQMIDDASRDEDRRQKTAGQKKALALSEVDKKEASKALSVQDAAQQRGAIKASYDLAENAEQIKAAEAILAKARELAAGPAETMDAATMAYAFDKSPANKQWLEESEAAYKATKGAVDDAQTNLGALVARRSQIENERDTENLKSGAGPDDNAAKREALGLELAIAEAKASGNTEAEKRLKWQQDYTRWLKEAQAAGLENPEDYARRGADAGKDVAKPKQPAMEVAAGADAAMLARIAGLAVQPKDAAAERMAKSSEESAKVLGRVEQLLTQIKDAEKGVFAV